MKNLRKAFNRFCYQNRTKGIPNLMLYISLGTAIVYFLTMVTQSPILYSVLCFNRTAILHGQIWRLFTYVFTFGAGSSNVFLIFIALFCYYSLGRTIEMTWGTFRFNIFYLVGIGLMDIYSLIFHCQADVYYLNMSLFLSYATLYPNATFLIFFIIPLKAWVLALIDLIIILMGVLTSYFPYNLFPIIALANYFLFFGSDVTNLLPVALKRKLTHKKSSYKKAEPIPFTRNTASNTQQSRSYTHRCTVCGRTDVTNPELEFRYCSKCNGYYCYCSDHINNHTHVQ